MHKVLCTQIVSHKIIEREGQISGTAVNVAIAAAAVAVVKHHVLKIEIRRTTQNAVSNKNTKKKK